jgi:Aerotolerance regulator N-terminal/von Willebrand factor type A domain
VRLLTPWALCGLAVLIPLVLWHLRRARRLEVPSTVIWQELLERAPAAPRWGRVLAAPLLLVLQVVAVILLVVVLARPVVAGSAPSPRIQAYVLDDSLWMTATDIHPDRLSAAKRVIDDRIRDAPPGTRLAVIVATGQPYVLIDSTARASVERALWHVAPTAAPPDPATAVQLAYGVVAGAPRGDVSVTIVHAPEDVPPMRGFGRTQPPPVTIGHSRDNQAVLSPSVRCGVPPDGACRVFAVVANEDDRSVADRLVVERGGRVLVGRSLTLAPRSATPLSFAAPPGDVVTLRLSRPDILALDNTAQVLVPARQRAVVTVVGAPDRTVALRLALASVPGVVVEARAPHRFDPVAAARSDLLVLDGWLPPGGLPRARAVLLVDPPSVPGGRVRGRLSDPAVSGVDPASPLLADVDLTSLAVASGAARRIAPPAWLSPVVWAPGGPLLAAGDNGRQRLAVLAFDPGSSNLPELAAFPLLAQNLVRWATALPSTVVAGEDVLLPAPPGTTSTTIRGPVPTPTVITPGDAPAVLAAVRPGLYTVIQRGPWGTRRAQVTADVSEPTAAGLTASTASTGLLGPPPHAGTAASRQAGLPLRPLWPWIILAALVAVVAEGLSGLRRDWA